MGVLKRDLVAEEMRALDQTARAQLRRYGVRFGAFNIFFPILLKPVAADLLLTLWCLRYGKDHDIDPSQPPEAPRAGLTSAKVDPAIPEAFYRAYGFHVCGPRAVRIDMLERLADHIRPLLSWRAKSGGDTPPKGSTGDGGFTVIPEMMSILGCSPEELGYVLTALGFRSEKREAPKSAPDPQVISPSAASDATSDPEASPSSAAPSDGVSDAASADVDPQPAEAVSGPGPTLNQDPSSVDPSPAAIVGGDTVRDAAQVADTSTPSADSSLSDAPPDQAAAGNGDETGAVIAAAASTGETPDSGAAVEPTTTDGAASTLPAATEDAGSGQISPTEPTIVPSADEAEASPPGQPVEASTGAANEVAAEPASELPTEPVMIEVWRPKRRHDGGQRRGRGSRQGARQGARGGQAGEAAPNANDDRSGRKDRAAKSRGDRDGKRPQRDGKGNRGPGRGKPRVDKAGGGRRDDKRRGLNVHTSAPARSKGMDPDSPFAALSALKESLGKNGSET